MKRWPGAGLLVVFAAEDGGSVVESWQAGPVSHTRLATKVHFYNDDILTLRYNSKSCQEHVILNI